METQASIPAAAPLHAPATWPTALRSGMDWGAILAGGVLAVGAGLVFKVFGAALGLTGISAEPGETGPFDLWIIATAVWMALTMVLTHLAGGYVAGRMRRRDSDLSAEEAGVRDGVHGLVVWALGMVVMGWLAVATLGAAVSTAGSVVGAASEGATALAEQAVAPDSDALSRIGDELARPAPSAIAGSDADLSALARHSSAILAKIAQTGEVSEADRSFLASAGARMTGLGPTEAEGRVDLAITAAQDLGAQTREDAVQARQAAEMARKGAILTAFLVAAASLIASAAAVVGGVYGGQHRDSNLFFAGLGFGR